MRESIRVAIALLLVLCLGPTGALSAPESKPKSACSNGYVQWTQNSTESTSATGTWGTLDGALGADHDQDSSSQSFADCFEVSTVIDHMFQYVCDIQEYRITGQQTFQVSVGEREPKLAICSSSTEAVCGIFQQYTSSLQRATSTGANHFVQTLIDFRVVLSKDVWYGLQIQIGGGGTATITQTPGDHLRVEESKCELIVW